MSSVLLFHMSVSGQRKSLHSSALTTRLSVSNLEFSYALALKIVVLEPYVIYKIQLPWKPIWLVSDSVIEKLVHECTAFPQPL